MIDGPGNLKTDTSLEIDRQFFLEWVSFCHQLVFYLVFSLAATRVILLKTGLLLMACIYAINWQVTDDVVVRRNITKVTSWVRDHVKVFASECALGFCHEFGSQSGIAIRFDHWGHNGSFLAIFYRA